MELIDDTYLGKPLRLQANLAGWQALFLDNQLVSQRAAQPADQEPEQICHRFETVSYTHLTLPTNREV